MSAVHSRRVVTAGSISLALALAAPLAAFAAPGEQGPPANPGEQRSATATATIGDQAPPANPGNGGSNGSSNGGNGNGNGNGSSNGGNGTGNGNGNGNGTQTSQGVGDEEQAERKVTICHATGSQSNPYVVITIAKSAVLNGHVDHQHDEDIIPSFTYKVGGETKTFPGQGDQSILAARCAVAADVDQDAAGGTGNGGGNGNGSDDSAGVGDEARDERKVTICHATGSETNPYVVITIAKSAVLNAHADHQGDEDIIPSFTYTVGGETKTFPGQGDQSILAAACAVPGETDQAPATGTPSAGGGSTETPVQGGGSTDTPAPQPVQGQTPDQPAQNPGTPQNPATPQNPTDIAGGSDAPATGALPQTPTPAPAPAPAPVEMAPLGEGEVVVEQEAEAVQAIGGTTTEAATVGLTPVPTTFSARGATSPATLPFTGGAELSILVALGVGALGLGGMANRIGTRELQAKHVLR